MAWTRLWTQKTWFEAGRTLVWHDTCFGTTHPGFAPGTEHATPPHPAPFLISFTFIFPFTPLPSWKLCQPPPQPPAGPLVQDLTHRSGRRDHHTPVERRRRRQTRRENLVPGRPASPCSDQHFCYAEGRQQTIIKQTAERSAANGTSVCLK